MTKRENAGPKRPYEAPGLQRRQKLAEVTAILKKLSEDEKPT